MKRYFLLAALTMSASAQADIHKGWECYEAHDYQCALNQFRPSADQGNADAQTVLGFMYMEGQGVRQDDAEAVKWYRLAAEQGNTAAQINLGFMYYRGLGVKQDNKLAMEWYGKACDNGSQDGCDKYKQMKGIIKEQKKLDDLADLWKGDKEKKKISELGDLWKGD